MAIFKQSIICLLATLLSPFRPLFPAAYIYRIWIMAFIQPLVYHRCPQIHPLIIGSNIYGPAGNLACMACYIPIGCISSLYNRQVEAYCLLPMHYTVYNIYGTCYNGSLHLFYIAFFITVLFPRETKVKMMFCCLQITSYMVLVHVVLLYGIQKIISFKCILPFTVRCVFIILVFMKSTTRKVNGLKVSSGFKNNSKILK